MRKQAIKIYFVSKCKPGANTKEFFDAFGPFLLGKRKMRRIIMQKENENYMTYVKYLYEIFVIVFSTNAMSIGCPDESDMTKPDFLTVTISKDTNHETVKAIRV